MNDTCYIAFLTLENGEFEFVKDFLMLDDGPILATTKNVNESLVIDKEDVEDFNLVVNDYFSWFNGEKTYQQYTSYLKIQPTSN